VTKPNDILVLLGRYDINNIDEFGTGKNDVQNIEIHPDWNPDVANYDADIALLILQAPVKFTNYIQLACLPLALEDPNSIQNNVTGFVVSSR
jgi:hypothetical protein